MLRLYEATHDTCSRPTANTGEHSVTRWSALSASHEAANHGNNRLVAADSALIGLLLASRYCPKESILGALRVSSFDGFARALDVLSFSRPRMYSKYRNLENSKSRTSTLTYLVRILSSHTPEQSWFPSATAEHDPLQETMLQSIYRECHWRLELSLPGPVKHSHIRHEPTATSLGRLPSLL